MLPETDRRLRSNLRIVCPGDWHFDEDHHPQRPVEYQPNRTSSQYCNWQSKSEPLTDYSAQQFNQTHPHQQQAKEQENETVQITVYKSYLPHHWTL
jgi:hypothetical protein